jgi:hypothetical protein
MLPLSYFGEHASGDNTGDKNVNVSDTRATKGQSGVAVTNANYASSSGPRGLPRAPCMRAR